MSPTRFSLFAAILISGFCYYSGNGLTGNFWYLLWIAPIPIIYISVKNNWKVAFVAAFLVGLIGRLSWLSYLIKVATLIPAIIITLLTAFIFAGIILLTRSAVLRLNKWYAVWAFPIYFTTYEYLLAKLSADGTALSIAYSQMDCLPFIQVAAIGGFLSITFILTLIPAYITFTLLYNRKWIYLTTSVLTLIAAVFISGYLRLNNIPPVNKIKVAMAVIPESKHNFSFKPDTTQTDLYVKQIDLLAGNGLQVVVLPERALGVNDAATNKLIAAAAKNDIFIIAGYTNPHGPYNSAIVIDNNGRMLTDYNKRHLVTGLESSFRPGNDIGLFRVADHQAGIAICKDLDFHDYIRQYAQQHTDVLFVPAWDFVVDDWLHSRMAILRGVENGFSEVRAARTGLLTISDCYGRVSDEVSSIHDETVTLTGEVSIYHVNTIYSQYGDWVGMVCLIISVLFHLFAFRRLKVSGVIPR